MSICLCNLSADVVLERASQNKLELTPASPDMSLFSADPEVAREAIGELSVNLPDPVELLVGSAKKRRVSVGVACHVWRGSIPGSAFLQLDEGVYVTSPEFTLLQQASQLHQANCDRELELRTLNSRSPKIDDQK